MNTKLKLIAVCMAISLWLMSALSLQAQRTFIFVNQTGQELWVGAQGNPLPANGGFVLAAGAEYTITVPAGSSAIRFWGRTGCNAATGICETGDCTRGVQCNGAGGIPPATLAEFTLNANDPPNMDFYDVSLVDGYNLPMRIIPVEGTYQNTGSGTRYDCGTAGCTSDLNQICPSELQLKNASGQVVGCKSACLAFDTDQYCCRDAYGTPQTCPPFNYSQLFKQACPDAYSYAYDDDLSTYTCYNATYRIIFGTGDDNPPTGTGQTIQAENYSSMAGVQTESCSDTGGGLNVGYIDTGDWLAYNSIAIPATGEYLVEYRVANASGVAGKLSLDVNAGAAVLGQLDVPVTGGWQTWTTISHQVTINAGTYNFGIYAQTGGWNLNWWRITPVAQPVTIQAESYSSMAGVQTESCSDTGGGLNVGYIDTGDWMAYSNVNFASAGSYLVEYRVASVSGGRLSLDLNAGTTVLGELAIPVTGGWQTWTTISHTVNVSAGTYSLGLYAQTGGWNLNWIRITKIASASQSTARSSNPSAATAVTPAAYDASNAETKMTIYPNPAGKTLTITSLPSTVDKKVSIVNENGKKVSELPLQDGTVDVSSLTPGIYFIVVKDGKKRVVGKFVKE